MLSHRARPLHHLRSYVHAWLTVTSANCALQAHRLLSKHWEEKGVRTYFNQEMLPLKDGDTHYVTTAGNRFPVDGTRPTGSHSARLYPFIPPHLVRGTFLTVAFMLAVCAIGTRAFWCVPPNRDPPNSRMLQKHFPSALDNYGYIKIDEHCRVNSVSRGNIFAIGDCTFGSAHPGGDRGYYGFNIHSFVARENVVALTEQLKNGTRTRVKTVHAHSPLHLFCMFTLLTAGVRLMRATGTPPELCVCPQRIPLKINSTCDSGSKAAAVTMIQELSIGHDMHFLQFAKCPEALKASAHGTEVCSSPWLTPHYMRISSTPRWLIGVALYSVLHGVYCYPLGVCRCSSGLTRAR